MRKQKAAHQALPWWEQRKTKFSICYAFAMHLLAITATEASSKQLFSIASQVLSKLHNTIQPEFIACIIIISENHNMLKKWYTNIRSG